MKDFEVCDEESLEKMLAKVRAAQEKFATYTQEQVDLALSGQKMNSELMVRALTELKSEGY